ncbi:MAG: hypothetical protein NVS1B7_0280 [Candidatus Saccharimonadales bacterium]
MSIAKAQKLAVETIGLSTPRGRLIFFSAVTAFIYVMPIKFLSHLSLWGQLGFRSPTIGLTRAYHYVLHGQFVKASQQNALVFTVLAIGIPIIFKDVYTMVIFITEGKYHARPVRQSNTR